MSKSSLSTGSDEASQCSSLEPRRLRRFDLLCTRFGKTARAVRDFVTCSSPQSNGFMEDSTTNSQEYFSSPIMEDVQSSSLELDETPTSTTEVLQLMQPSSQQQVLPLRDKPVTRDVWSVRNGISPPHAAFVRDSSKARARHPSHCHWRTTHGQANNAECNRRAYGAEVTSTSTCGHKLPTNFFELPTKQRLRAVKQFLAGFVCKPNSETSLQANKQRPLCRLMATARMIVYKPEPIKPVEAVFLALYLTAGLVSVERTPLCFKTKFADEVSQHIVVLVQHNGKYGAFGISPNPDLMTKDFQFDSMSSIVENYLKAYKAMAHTVLKIRIGLPVEHDVMSTHFICWRHLCLSPDVKSWAECVVEIENHVLRMRRLWDLWVLTGKGDDPRKAQMTRRKLTPDTVTSMLAVPKPAALEKQIGQAPRVVVTGPAATTPAAKVELSKPVNSSKPPSRHCDDDDAESTGSVVTTEDDNDDNCEHCEHCEQLKRDAPPSDTKRASVTTVKRFKQAHKLINPQQQQQYTGTTRDSDSSTLDCSNSVTGALLASAARELQLNRRDRSKASVHFPSRRSLNHVSLAATKQILKNFVHSSVLLSPPTPPPRRFSRRSNCQRDQNSVQRNAGRCPQGQNPSSVRRKMNRAHRPLYTLSLAATKSNAG